MIINQLEHTYVDCTERPNGISVIARFLKFDEGGRWVWMVSDNDIFTYESKDFQLKDIKNCPYCGWELPILSTRQLIYRDGAYRLGI